MVGDSSNSTAPIVIVHKFLGRQNWPRAPCYSLKIVLNNQGQARVGIYYDLFKANLLHFSVQIYFGQSSNIICFGHV